MEKSRLAESRIAEILNKSEAGLPLAQLTRKHSTSAATFLRLELEEQRCTCL